jgi:hypothetical protein
MLYPVVNGQSTQSSFWSSQRLGQTWSNLPELREMCSRPRLKVPLMWWGPVGSKWLSQTSVKLGQTWSNLPKLQEMCSEPRLEVLLM